MNREIFEAIKYLDFAPASQRRVPSDTPQSDDQGRPGEGSPCRLEETTRDRNWWICVALVAAGLGGLLLWVK